MNFLLLTAVACACASDDVFQESRPEQVTPCVAVENPYLPNAYRIHERVFSGGQPTGSDGFHALHELGVRTIISVDGIEPDVEVARDFGLRYVHLPHGYDGISPDRAAELARAVRQLPGPIYIHCHYGKHRSPAAASVACIGAGLIPESLGPSILQLAGTSPDYRGLYQSVANARPIDPETLASLQVDFQESIAPPPLVEAMAALEHRMDRLHSFAEAGWRTKSDQSIDSPAHESLLLKELFVELGRDPDVIHQPDHFRALVAASASQSESLETLLKSGATGKRFEERATTILTAIESNCRSCHQRFRD